MVENNLLNRIKSELDTLDERKKALKDQVELLNERLTELDEHIKMCNELKDSLNEELESVKSLTGSTKKKTARKPAKKETVENPEPEKFEEEAVDDDWEPGEESVEEPTVGVVKDDSKESQLDLDDFDRIEF